MKERASRNRWPRTPRVPTSDPERQLPLVFYVEDNTDNQQIMQMRLGNEYEVVIAGTDRQACELFRQHLSRMQVILMDIELQGSTLNGIQLAALMKGRSIYFGDAELPEYARDMPSSLAPLLFVTAYSDKYKAHQLKATGAVGIIHKPVNFTELRAMLDQCAKMASGESS